MAMFTENSNGVSNVPLSTSNEVSDIPLSATNEVSDIPLSAENEDSNDSIPCDEKDDDFVTIPDLFVSFVSVKPQANPFYEKVKAESENWIAEVCNYSDADRKKRVRADFPYFAALWTAEAAETEFRCITDWCNWVFDFDDMFDDGHLNEDPAAAQSVIDDLMSIMTDQKRESLRVFQDPKAGPLWKVFDNVWFRFQQRASMGNQRRFINAMRGFCRGLLRQVEVRNLQILPDEEHYLELRRESIGVYPCLALAEYFNGLDLPDHVFQDRAIKILRECAADIVLLQNDVLSYHKEQSMGVLHNIIQLFRQQGFSQQKAYDRVDVLLRERYRWWYLCLSQIPVYGERIDPGIQKYIRACQDIVLANLNWSFKSERYFGSENSRVRATRRVRLISSDSH